MALDKPKKQRAPGYPRGTETQRGTGGFAKRLPRNKKGEIDLPKGYIIDWDSGFELMFGKHSDKIPSSSTKPYREEFSIPKGGGAGFNYTKV